MRASRRAFTLIEVLIVVIIVAVLAAVAVPRFSRSKANAQVAAMKSDLRNLITAQETYRADSARYANTLTALAPYRTSPGVGVTLNAATTTTWQATATHTATSRTCSVRMGVGERDVEPLCD